MQPDIELSLVVEFDELFALRDRIRAIADQVRARLLDAGVTDRLEAEVFDSELELRGPEGSRLIVRLDSFRLEITGVPMEFPVHILSAILLDEAGVFRLGSVEVGFAMVARVGKGLSLGIVQQAFGPVEPLAPEPMLDRRFGMTWEWGTATTGFSFVATVTEDREVYLTFKAREGYMNLVELQAGEWLNEQAQRFDGTVSRFLSQIGYKG